MAKAKQRPMMLRPVGRVVGTGWWVRPTEVRERQERPSRESRRQRGHLANFNQLKIKRRNLNTFDQSQQQGVRSIEP